MHKKNYIGILTIFLLLALSFSVHANLPAPNIIITSQPATGLYANSNYALVFNITDTTNDTVNVTAKFFVNGANVKNSTWTNNLTNSSLNIFSTTFNENYYVRGDSVYTNITVVEALNSTVTNQTLTNTIIIGQSTTSVIAADTLEGLPSMGTAVGDFMGNLAPGLFKFLLLISLAVAIVALIVAIIFIVRTKASSSFK